MKNKETGYPHIDKPWMKYYEGLCIPNEEKTDMVSALKYRNRYRMDKIAYEYYGKQISYEEMFNNADKASSILTELGVKKGDIILTMVPNIPEEEEIWFGATQIGAICDYIDPRPDSMDIMQNAKKTLEIIKYEKPKFIVALDKCYLGMLKPIENELKELGINDIILLNQMDSMDSLQQDSYMKDAINYERLSKGNDLLEGDNLKKALLEVKNSLERISNYEKENAILSDAIKNSPLRVHKYKDLLKECKDIKFDKISDPELVNYIGHTSGTSGARPKPIALSNKNAICSVVQCEVAGVGPKEGETSLHLLPGFAPFGRYNNDIQSYYNKGTNIHIPEFILGEFGYLIKKYKPNAFMTPPALLTTLPDCKYLKNEDLSYVTKVIYGGDAMTPKDEEKINKWLRERGSYAEVEKGHGMSEYCGCGTYAKDAYNKPNTIGIPAPRTIYTIVDPNVESHLVPLKFKDGEDKLRGEIAVSAGHVTNGKLHDEVIVPHYEMDGRDYIRTKDIGYMDRDGCFFIDERKGRSFARVDGFKVKPSEIEKEIEKNDMVKRARIVGYFDERIKGVMPICHLVLEKNDFSDEDEIKLVENIVYNNIISNPMMNSRQIPSKFKIREEMPLNKGNKIDDIFLREESTEDTINVDVNETNVAVGSIEIYRNKKGKVRSL